MARIQSITSGRLLARNSLWNLLGQGAPLVVAIFAIPILIRGLGTDRFGILTLAWVFIGYFSFFDLGLSRALIQLVARNLGAEREEEIAPLIWTALTMMVTLGALGAAVFGLMSPLLIRTILKIPSGLQTESLEAFLVLAAAIPVVISTAALRGILEANQLFALANAVRIPVGVFTYLGPVLVLPFSKSIFWVVIVLLAGRVVAGLGYLILCLHAVASLRERMSLDRSVVMPLLRFGGWMTVSNVVSPFLVYFDRLLIGAVISVSAVAFYATPYEVVTKFLVIPTAIAGVLFPAFSTSYVRHRDRAGNLLLRGVKYVFILLFPITLLIVTLAHQGLEVWLGSGFASHSAHVFQWLSVGVLFNSLAMVPFALVQGAGRPDLTAKLHLLELPVYLVVLWWLLTRFGIDGAAVAWMTRAGIDMLVLSIIAFRLSSTSLDTQVRAAFALGIAVITLVVASLAASLTLRLVWLVAVVLGFGLIVWFRVLSSEERALGRHGLSFVRFRH